MLSIPGRRSACVRCVKGKRKCDATKPKCGRCIRFGAACQYVDHDDMVLRNTSAASITTPGTIAEEFLDYADLKLDMIYSAKVLSQMVRLPEGRLRYCAQKLIECPVTMVKQGQTPFIKAPARAEELAKPLHEAYSACAVYCCQSAHNGDLMKLLLIDKYRMLLEAPWTGCIRGDLAQAQAVLLLHIILLLDGDARLRSEGEKGLEQIRARILRLQRRAELETFDVGVYSHWVLAESIRRTILAATFTESIYLSLTEGVCTTLPFMSLLPITVSGKLWAAVTESEWREEFDPVNSATMAYGEAVDVWNQAAGRDSLEDLQQVLFAACKGLPAAYEAPGKRTVMVS